ncbi:MAG TPA: protein kinase, partial [Polyangiaceae bacterium LLY-WYZ-15_(1-7)]|nr:protein kinase [Polyangiaceae bacterium LLY-WYZ-15_(1-7)]
MSFAGSDRFELRTRLGKGAFGVVYRARDVHRSADVALKTLHRVAPDALLRFKTEFRALQDLQHPNVVHFHELFEEEGEWFFTMELVEGVELLDWVCPERPLDPSAETLAARFDEARLRDALKQLAGALAALHEAGLVHRDLKPSNVRVTPEGRVVLLDFGLVVDTAGEADAAIVGTPAYMAPEQAHSKQVGPAADLYGLGVLLFEALTGTLPFAGAPLRIITLKQREEPPPPRVLAADVPFDLDALCEELLRREPERRPSAKQVRRRLGRGSSTPPPSTPAPDPHFVGRELELDVLRAAYRESRQEGFRSVVVEGESGVGKSALVQAFASSLADDDAVVLRGRCYEHETVPYKAFDGIVDALAKYLERLPDEQCEAVLPRRAALLEHVFPVLGQVRAIALAPRTRRPPREGLQLREAAFEALIELFARLADRVPLVLTVDDLQWADDESLLFLEALREPPDAPALLFVATARPLEDECPPNVRACVERCADRRIALGGLGGREARDPAEQILQLGGSALDADELAAQAGGHPLFIAELARHVQRAALRGGPLRIDLDAALRERVEQLPPEARRCLFASCVAARPLDRELLRDACGLDESFDRIVKALRVGRFVRTARRGETATVEPFHDRVRAAAMAALGPGERELQHRRIGLALEKHRDRDVEALALHFREAGDRVRAARYALAAGDRAAEALAFHRAAEHYADALRL